MEIVNVGSAPGVADVDAVSVKDTRANPFEGTLVPLPVEVNVTVLGRFVGPVIVIV
jgi:hypothetical protein